jgi:flagellin-specific chaperone FliS
VIDQSRSFEVVKKFYRSQESRNQDVLGASSFRLVVMAYDVAINACETKDFMRATKVVNLLQDALYSDYAEAAVGLFSVYQWCLDCIRQEDYSAALQAMRELREAWAAAEKRHDLSVYAEAFNIVPMIGAAT